ncbi:cation efflux family-domain-containing protein [Xylaria bambusicola]|uniref:cation efflux family-domain-containing protein n=1 Tax=Xylaria bambusicola TaxID=326684 RepID=UPI002008E044|nr:cation efflux family-domain-containing protein [Xylaria bambusicola]KAI0502971.1 cation efflux family-domain-containing protein [Xylaria bambusicola]
MAPVNSPIPPPISIIPAIETPGERDQHCDNHGEDNSGRFASAYRLNASQPALTPASAGQSPNARYSFHDPKRLSPFAPTFQDQNALLVPGMASNNDDDFSNENSVPIDTPKSDVPNPFNFQTQVISTSPVKPNVGQRRGHKYKHSSISAQHQIFLEPPPRAPLALPRDLPMPTLQETWKSMSRDQRHRLYWCICHALVAVWLFLSAHGSLTMTALSHLVFFDVGSALICVAVEVLGNFEVWKRSSIRYPFGLERAEVLAGFAMSIFLIFGGFDLVSHNAKHILEGHGGDGSHEGHVHEHDEPRVAMGSIDFVSLAAIAATLISAFGLRNHARISRAMRVSYLASLPSILSNPFHFLTLSVSTLLVMLPLFSIHLHIMLDSIICGLIALSMFGLGVRLAIAQGLMLLMSYGGRTGSFSGRYKEFGVSDVLREIETEPSIERVEEAQFWQVHYGLCMANLKVSVAKSCDDATLSRLRTRISNLIQNRLGEGYGRGGSLKWEVSLQTAYSSSTAQL